MDATVQKWGNSLGLRIPKAFAAELGVEAGTTVGLSVEQDRLVVQIKRRPKFTLETLLAGVRKENLHDEIQTGDAVGGEAW